MRKTKLSNDIYLSFCALLLTNLIWAAAVPVIKLTLDYIPPLTFLFVRFLIVGIVLLPFVVLQLNKYKIHKDDLSKILILGLASQTSLALIFMGLKYTSALDTAIIGVLGPLLSMVAGNYFFKDRMNDKIKLGILLAGFGSLIVVIEPILMGSDGVPILNRVFGNFLVILYNLSFLLYVIWSKISLGQSTKNVKKALSFLHMKPMKNKYPATMLMSLAFYVGLITLVPLAIVENLGFFGSQVAYDLSNLGKTPILGILYMALISSIIAYFAFEWALNKVTVTETAILGYLSPIFTIPFAYLLLREVPTKYNLLGGFIIAVGIVLAEIASHEKQSYWERIKRKFL